MRPSVIPSRRRGSSKRKRYSLRAFLERLEPRVLLASDLHGLNEKMADGHDHDEHHGLEDTRLDFAQLKSHHLFDYDGFLSDVQAGEPFEIAHSYLGDNASLLGLDSEDFESILVTDIYTSDHNGVTHIYLRQTFGDLEVLGADLNINISDDGQVINVGSAFLPDLHEQAPATEPVISAIDAVAAFAGDLSLPFVTPPTVLESPAGTSQSMVLSGGDLSLEDIPVSLHYVPTRSGELELAWNFDVRTDIGHHWYDASVSAVDGELLALDDWVAHAADQYRVFAFPLESPDDGARTLVTDPADTTASPFGWHDTNGVAGAEFTDTRGNNVVATIDRQGTSLADGFRPDGGAALEFDFALDLSQEPINNQAAAVTNLFYWNNVLHDIHYQYGFNEAAGNFQVNNYGNGGAGGDQVQAEAQFGAETGRFNNAFMATPPDGRVPQMAMFEFNRTVPGRDSDFDNGVIIHEYGHGITNRLTGGPSNAGALQSVQSGGMGEGWGDWWALMFAQEPGDSRNDPHGLGSYGLGTADTTGGFRRQPYSFDMTIDPVTYGTFNLSSQVHNAGEIWASALWDMNWLLIEGDGELLPARGYDPDLYNGKAGNNLALQLVMDGLKLQPANPSFLDARDAILMADRVNNSGANQLAIWTAFARRGMGFSANDGGNANATTVTEAFDLPAVSRGIVALDRETYEVGDQVMITLRDLNLTGAGTADVVVTSNGGDEEVVSLPETGTGLFEGSIATGPAGASGDGTLNVMAGDQITVTYNDANDGSGNPAVAEDTADVLALIDVFRQDFESGLGPNETVGGAFGINISNTPLNNGSMMMGHPTNYGDLEYSFYEVAVDLTSLENAVLSFDFAAQLEDDFDGFNLQASSSAISPPSDLLFPTTGMSYDNFSFAPQTALGTVAYDSNGIVEQGTATFDLSSFNGQVVNLRFQFGSDQSVTNPGINIDNVVVRAVPTAGVAGTIEFDSETYRFGDTVTVTLRDTDIAGLGQVGLPLFSDSGDRETIVLEEIAAGIYQGSIGSGRSGAVSDGTINANPGESILIGYVDEDDGTGNRAEVSDTAQFLAELASVAFDSAFYEVGDTVAVAVVDADLAGLGPLPLTLMSSGGDSESITIVETDPGVFAGTIPTSAGGASNDGTLNVDAGDLITATFVDPDGGTGNPTTVTQTATIVSMFTIFSQDFESGLSAREDVSGGFAINDSNAELNNGTMMMGHASSYGDSEYSFYEFSVNLTGFRDVALQFDYAAQIEDGYDRFNVLAGTGFDPIDPPNGLLQPISGLPYQEEGLSTLPQIGPVGYDGDGVLDTGTAVFDLSEFEGDLVTVRLQFGSDESITNPGINIDNVIVTGELVAERAGTVEFDQERYENDFELVRITLSDRDLLGGDAVELEVEATSGDRETVTFVQVGGVFRSAIILQSDGTVGDGRLAASSGDQLTVTYNDADDGTGNPAVVTDTADVISLEPIFVQAFEAGLTNNERVSGAFSVNSTNPIATNGSNMMGHPNFYSNFEYSFYEVTVDLTGHTASKLTFLYEASLEEGYDAFNVLASTSTIVGPEDLLLPTPDSTLEYQELLAIPQPEIGSLGFTGASDLGPLGLAEFDLSQFDGQVVNVRFQFGSDEFLTDAGINIDDVSFFGVPNDPGRGRVTFDAQTYEIGDLVRVTLNDSDLAGTASVDVSVVSSGGDSETVSLSESVPGLFEASIPTDAAGSAGDGTLNVAAGEAITVTYNDADDGTGSPSVVTDVATIIELETFFFQDFESGLADFERTFGAFQINDTNVDLNNGTRMMGHPSPYGNNELSFYLLAIDLRGFSNVELRFDFASVIEDTFDGFNVQVGTPPLNPPEDLIRPVSGMRYDILDEPLPFLGDVAFDSDGQFMSGTAVFDLSPVADRIVDIALQFASDASVIAPGINIDNLEVRVARTSTPTLDVDVAAISEAGGSATVTVALPDPAAVDTTVELALAGTATESSDYEIVPSQVVIPAGQTAGTAIVTALQDSIAEGDETVVLSVADSDGSQVLELFILDDELRVFAGTGIDGLNPLSVVELDVPSIRETPIESSSLNLGLDADPFSGLLFGASNELRSIDPVTGETRTIGSIDSPTTSSITMASISFSPGGILYGIASATAVDEHVLYTIDPTTAEATVVGEIDPRIRAIEFTPNGILYGAYDALFIVDPSDATATEIGALDSPVRELDASSDGQLLGVGIVSQSDRLFLIHTSDASQSSLGDFDSELSSVASQGGPPLVSLDVDNLEVQEDGGVATFTANLSSPAALPASVVLDLTGTATLGDDYDAPAVTIEIPSGATSGSISVTAVADGLSEEDETIIAEIVDVVGAFPGGNQVAVTTIVDGVAATSFQVVDSFLFDSGVAIVFNSTLDPEDLNLYGGEADLTVTGAASGPVSGSLVIDPSLQAVTFVKTGGPLVPDEYTATLRSEADAFKDADGNLLDGDADGTAGGDFVATFTIDAPADNSVTISIPDFVRGPGQPVNLPADVTTGIPIVLSQSEGQPSARDVEFVLTYDPALLQINGGFASGGATVSIDTSTPGEATVSYSTTTDLSAGDNTIVNLIASVPAADASTILGRSHLLDINSSVVRDAGDNELPARNDGAVHLVSFFADVTGNGRINPADAAQVAQFAALIRTGFSSSFVTDPIVIGDISGNGRLNARDASLVAQHAALLPVDEIPDIPSGVLIAGLVVPAGVEPQGDDAPVVPRDAGDVTYQVVERFASADGERGVLAVDSALTRLFDASDDSDDKLIALLEDAIETLAQLATR